VCKKRKKIYANAIIGNIGSLEILLTKDTLSPFIVTTTPSNSSEFTASNPLRFTIKLTEINQNFTRFTIDDDDHKYTFKGLQKTIDQNIWASMQMVK
jgi:hypothetical protein